MNKVFRLVHSVYDRNPYILEVNVLTKQAACEHNKAVSSSLRIGRRATVPLPLVQTMWLVPLHALQSDSTRSTPERAAYVVSAFLEAVS